MMEGEISNQQQTEAHEDKKWDIVLTHKTGLFSLPWRDLIRYRDLLLMFVKRDVIIIYKQTILGPVWFFIQPILTTLTYMFVFNRVAGLSTDGLPALLFYSSGIVTWNYFSESLTITSRTFTENASLFGKVYFPRIIVPLAKVSSGLLKFFVQFLFFLAVLVYYLIAGTEINANYHIIFVPFLIVLMAGLGLGLGIIFTSMTTKYRDLNFLIQFGVVLMMYATPVIYPLSMVRERYANYETLFMLNPVTSIVEGFRYAFLGAGTWSWAGIGYTTAFTTVVLTIGILVFSKVEKTFMDTV